MANKKYTYEYINEESIDHELICIICSEPLVDPISTPCDHTFCSQCIKQWIEFKKSCPLCRHEIKSVHQFIQVSCHLRNILDQLLIKCSTCGQRELKRIDFNYHIDEVCPQVNVSCSAIDIKCPWTGSREELPTHLTTCKHEPLRSLLTQLITENEELEIKNKQLNIKKEELLIKMRYLSLVKEQLIKKVNDNK